MINAIKFKISQDIYITYDLMYVCFSVKLYTSVIIRFNKPSYIIF